MTLLEEDLRRLLRWYPRAWRERHGEVMLATLLDDADARGHDAPTRADAWSIRMHGIAARATPGTAAALAAASCAALLVVVALSSLDPFTSWTIPVPAGSDAFGPISLVLVAMRVVGLGVALPLLAASVLALVAARRPAGASAVVLALAAILVTSAVLAVADVVAMLYPTVVDLGNGSWTTTGTPSGVLVAASALLAAGLLPFAEESLPRGARSWWRWPLALLAAATTAGLVVVTALTLLTPILAVVMLLVALAAMRTTTSPAVGARGWSSTFVGGAAGVALCLGVPMLAFGVLALHDAVPVDQEAMRLVQALAAAAGIPTVLAGVAMLRASAGRRAWLVAALLIAAVVVACVAIVLGAARPAYVPITIVAGALGGAGIGATTLLLGPRSPWSALVAGATAVVVAVLVAQGFTLLVPGAWIAGVPLLVAAIVRARRDARASAPRSQQPSYGWQTGQR